MSKGLTLSIIFFTSRAAVCHAHAMPRERIWWGTRHSMRSAYLQVSHDGDVGSYKERIVPDLAEIQTDVSGDFGQRTLDPPRNSELDPPFGYRELNRTEHVNLLNKDSFWWLMMALLSLIGILVLRLGAPGIVEETGKRSLESLPRTSVSIPDVEIYTWPYIRHLVECAVALNIAMLIWGIAQEYIMTLNYGAEGSSEEYFPSVFLVLFCNRSMTSIISAVSLKFSGQPLYSQGWFLSGGAALTNLLASFCQYESLRYISFILMTTVKSAKLVPVLVLSSLRGKKYSVVDYVEVLVILTALIVFGIETDGSDDRYSNTSTTKGIVLVLGLLVADSVTPHVQDACFVNDPELSPLQLTFSTSSIASITSLLLLMCSGAALSCISFLMSHPIAILHLFLLSLASSITQYLISYIIKNFGPVVFSVIAATRQMVSVSFSSLLFRHRLSPVAVVGMLLTSGTIIERAVRPPANFVSNRFAESQPTLPEEGSARTIRLFERFWAYQPIFLCVAGIYVMYCIWGLIQEFMANHTFNGELFEFPTFLIAISHTASALFACICLRAQGLSLSSPQIKASMLPASTNFLASFLQHQAFYKMYYPAHTLMKSLKIIPVMLVGRLLRNRTYTSLDYVQGAVITGLVAFFQWDFPNQQQTASEHNDTSLTGILLMCGYIVADSFTPNLEDYAYQSISISPAQLLFGLEVVSGSFAWAVVIIDGNIASAFGFIWRHPDVTVYMALLAMASSCGAYTSTLTVRLFGPAVFVLIMVARQLTTIVISMILYGYGTSIAGIICLASVSFLVLGAALRSVSEAREAQPQLAENKPGDKDKAGKALAGTVKNDEESNIAATNEANA